MDLSKKTIVTVLELLKDEQELLKEAVENIKEEYEDLSNKYNNVTAAIDEIEEQLADNLIK